MTDTQDDHIVNELALAEAELLLADVEAEAFLEDDVGFELGDEDVLGVSSFDALEGDSAGEDDEGVTDADLLEAELELLVAAAEIERDAIEFLELNALDAEVGDVDDVLSADLLGGDLDELDDAPLGADELTALDDASVDVAIETGDCP